MATLTSTAETEEGRQAAAAKRVIAFVNAAHALDHFSILIYATAVIAIAKETALDYSGLITLSTGAFAAFGFLSLPVGFAANRIGRRNMLALFFFGTALACAGLATASSSTAFAIWLLVLGSFAAIYHPVGSAILVANAPAARLGRTLGVNGVWGNLGVASAPIITAALASTLGWRAAFLVPALISAAIGIAFLMLVPPNGNGQAATKSGTRGNFPARYFRVLVVAFVLAVAFGGTTFNLLSVALPKVIDERLGVPLPLWLVGSLTTIIFLFGALTQLNVGRIIERQPLPRLFAVTSIFQPLGLILASFSTGVPLLLGLLFSIAAIYGNVVIVDAMVARYIPDEYRSRAYGIRYFVGFAVPALAVQLIGWLHNMGGFPLVLAVAAFCGFCLFLSAAVVWKLMTPIEADRASTEVAG